MSLTGRLLTWWMHLPPARTHDIVTTRNIPIPMPDGTVLLADRYAPRSGRALPTILIRTPYGRRGLFGGLLALPYAERGYQVLIQSCRGTAGSEGQFYYAHNEHDDGLATIAWLKQQPWYSGEFAMLGASYLGFVQWAIANDAGPDLKALIPQVTAADFHHFRYEGGSFLLETVLDWSTMMTTSEKQGLGLRSLLAQVRQARRMERAYERLPLEEADCVVIGRSSQHFQAFLQHGPDDGYWRTSDVSHNLAEVEAPVYLMGGWYDLFLAWQLRDYQALRAAGKQPYLLVGPWTHAQISSSAVLVRESLAWLDAHVKGRSGRLREAPVRLYVMGEKAWRDFADWPPPARQERWYLQPGCALSPEVPPASEPDHFRYDPADATPAVGGNSLGARMHMGPKDNRALEARPDVLVYTSAMLERDMEVIGPLSAELYVRSSLAHTDFFARLCVVEESGKSVNLCDGILRLTPGSVSPEPDGSLHISIEVWPTAYHFRRGQRVRLQVSSGAHPRFARNPGSGEAIASGTKLCVAEQTVYHDPDHPSAIVLPVLDS